MRNILCRSWKTRNKNIIKLTVYPIYDWSWLPLCLLKLYTNLLYPTQISYFRLSHYMITIEINISFLCFKIEWGLFSKDFVAKSRNILYIIEPNTYILEFQKRLFTILIEFNQNQGIMEHMDINFISSNVYTCIYRWFITIYNTIYPRFGG